MVGRTDEGRAVLRRLEELSSQRYVSPYHMAYVHTGLGDKERAMDWLERAYRERAGGDLRGERIVPLHLTAGAPPV